MTDEPSSEIPAIDAPDQDLVPRRSLLRNVAALFSAQVVTWAITTTVMVIVPRRVGPDDAGMFRVAGSVWAVPAVVIGFGTTTLMTLEVARNQSRSAIHCGPMLATRVLGFVLMVPVVGAFVAVAGYSREVVVLAVIAGVSVIVVSFGEVAGSALAGLEQFGAIARTDVTAKLVGAVLMISAAVVTRDIRVIAIAALVASAFGTGLLYHAVHGLKRIDLGFDWAAMRSVLRRGAPYFVIGVTLVAYNQIDVVVMSLLVSDEVIGWYATADVLFSTLLFIPTIVMSSLLPVLTRKHLDDPNAATEMLSQGFRTLLLLAVPVGLGTVVVAGPVSVLLFGEAFAGTGPVLSVMGIVLIFTFQTVLLGQHAIATNRQRLWNVVLAIAIPMTVVLDLVLVPWTEDRYDNGAIGGALSYVATEAMMMFVGIWKLVPELASRPVIVRVLKCAAAGAVMVAVAWPLRDLLIVVPIVAGAVTYGVALLITRPFDESEKVLLRRIGGRVPFVSRFVTW